MKIQKILISFIFIVFSFFIANISFSAINMTISPIKYELTASTGATITREAKITNHTDSTIHIITGKSDFVANGENGVPRFIRKSEVVFEQELSDWITIDTPEFDINPNETKTINFTINIPDNATPGGHYGAVFFKNNNSEQSSGTSVGINVDYGVLILLDVSGDINSEIEIGEPIISNSGGGNTLKKDNCKKDVSGSYYDGKCSLEETNISDSGSISGTGNTNNEIIINKDTFIKDNCIIDLTSSKYDKKCIDNFDNIIAELTGNIENTDLSTNDDLEKENDDFRIKIVVPVENKGNTHIKPNGEITLIDENGNQIKKVGKKVITNDRGAIIGEQIVDYIPFNDEGGNILPGTKRVYDGSWKGFPHQEINQDGEKEMFYWDPSEYYTRQNGIIGDIENLRLYPWERICEREQNKTITAKFNINYSDENGENIEYNSAKDFKVKYTEKYIGLNPYFFFILFLALFGFWILWLIFRKKKKICINKKCEKRINKDMKICPYCETKQEKILNKTNTKIKKDDLKKEITKKIGNKKPLIVPIKKQKIKTTKLELSDNIKNILIENKLKFAEDLTKITKQDLLEIKGIGPKAIEEIKKALKNEKMKLKK